MKVNDRRAEPTHHFVPTRQPASKGHYHIQHKQTGKRVTSVEVDFRNRDLMMEALEVVRPGQYAIEE